MQMSDLSNILYGSLNSEPNEQDVKPGEFSNFFDPIQTTTLQSIESLFKPNGQPKLIDPRFQGQHSIWARFTMLADGYTCKECEILYPNSLKKFTPPPSTTVAMRHMREKHPEICKLVEEEERERKASKGVGERKRASTASPNNLQNFGVKLEKTSRKQPKISLLPNSLALLGIEMLEQPSMEENISVENEFDQNNPLDLESLKSMHMIDSSSQLIREDIAEILAIPQFSIEMLSHPKMHKLLHNLDPNVNLPSTSQDLLSVLRNAKDKKIQESRQIFDHLPWRINISYHIFHDDSNLEYVSATAFYVLPNGEYSKFFLGTQLIEENNAHEAVLKILDIYGLSDKRIFKFIISGSFSALLLSTNNFKDNLQNDMMDVLDANKIDLKNLNLEKLQHDIRPEPSHKPFISFEHALELAIQTAVGTTSKNNGALSMLELIHKCQSGLAKLYLKSTCQKWIPFPKFSGWGSFVVILHLFLKFKKQIFELAQQTSWSVPSESQMNFLEELHQILYPFLNIFYKIHVNPEKSHIPISHVYSSVKYFIYALDSRMGERKGDAKVMSFILLEQLKSKFNYIIDPTEKDFEPLYLIAALLDPNFSHTVDQAVIEQISEEIYKMIRSKFPATVVQIKSEPVQTPNGISEFELPEGTNPFLQSLFQTCQNIPISTEKSPTELTFSAIDPTRLAIQTYINFALKNRTQNIDPIKFWLHCDPNFAPIKELAVDILSMPSIITEFSCLIDSTLSQYKSDLKSGLLNDKLVIHLNDD